MISALFRGIRPASCRASAPCRPGRQRKVMSGTSLVLRCSCVALHRCLPVLQRLRRVRRCARRPAERRRGRRAPGSNRVPRPSRMHLLARPLPASNAIRSPVRDRVEGVGDGDDARRERDAPSLQLARISASVPSLVVREHSVGEIGIERVERREHVGAALGCVGRRGAPPE